MTASGIEVWLFHPAGDGSVSNPLRRLIESECEVRGWSLAPPRPTRRTRSSEGRPLVLIKNEDATNLYKRIHRVRVGVWQIGKAHVPIKPQPRPTANDYVQLSRFIRHKAFHATVSDKSHWYSSLTEFDKWLNGIWCDNEGDPRCLPFHTFETDFETKNLTSQEGRSTFSETHGPQSSRVDHNQLRWDRPQGSYHGRDTLHIAGYELVRGFHWDVSSEMGKQRVTTTSDVWEIRRKGYVNVYPDAHIREGRLSKRITPTHKAKAR